METEGPSEQKSLSEPLLRENVESACVDADGESPRASEALSKDGLSSHSRQTGAERNHTRSNSQHYSQSYNTKKGDQDRHGESKSKRRLVAELQIETLSTLGTRFFLYSWYAMLILALVLQSFVSLQWQMTNICDAATENLGRLDTWSSPCVTSDMHRSSPDWNAYGMGKRRFSLPIQDFWSRDHVEPARGVSLRASDSLPKPQYDLRWVGTRHRGMLDVKLNRFSQIILSMASPQEHIPDNKEEKEYRLMVALEESFVPSPNDSSSSSSYSSFSRSSSASMSTYSSGSFTGVKEGRREFMDMNSETTSSSSDDSSDSGVHVYVYNTTTFCHRTALRCSSVVLPQRVAVTNNESRLTLTIFDVDPELANVSSHSAVGIVFQKARYTIGTIAWRYAFMLISIIQLIRFLYRRRFSRTLYEQYWVMLLHVGLFFYLDPLFAAGIYEPRGAALYHILEFRVPNCFAALLICFVFAVIMASLTWEHKDSGVEDTNNSPKKEVEHSLGIEEKNEVDSTTPLCLSEGRPPTPRPEKSAHLTPSESHRTSIAAVDLVRDIYVSSRRIPYWANFVMFFFFFTVLALQVAQVIVEDENWDTNVVCNQLRCLCIRYTVYSILLLGILVCCGLLFWLNRNLGHRSYLESRPQQLACRVFIFVFSTAFVYFVVQVILIAVLFPQILEIVSYQPLTQLSPMMVSTFFVNHITFVYTTTVASRRVPIRPDNPKWRRVVWSKEWYRWLANHGGILYIFHSERQERYFNWLQNKQQLTTKERQERGAKKACDTQTAPTTPKIAESAGDSSSAPFLARVSADGTGLPQPSEGDKNDKKSEKESYTVSDKESEEWSSQDGDSDTPPSSPLDGAQRRSGVLQFLARAEHHFIGRSATLIDRLEEALVDPVQSLLLRGNGRIAFFNLETAIDCFNLSWEAYAVTESQGDAAVTMGIDVDPRYVPRAAAGAFCRMLHRCMGCCACCGSSDSNDEVTVEVEVEEGEEVEERKGKEPKMTKEAEEEQKDRKKEDEKGSKERSSSTTSESSSSAPRMNTEQYGYKRIAVFEARAVQVIVAAMDCTLPCHRHKLPRLVVAFRGTDNVANAREDLRFRHRTWREVERHKLWDMGQTAKVHRGFLDTWITLKERVLGTVREYLEERGSVVHGIFTTGHSLGGALASLCAYSLRRMLRIMHYPLPEVTVYTFGQPAIGNKTFQTAYDKVIPRHFRVVNESDAVSFFRLCGGSHVGIEVDIDRHGNYICKPMFIERLFRPTKGKGFAVTNHTLTAYAQSLNAVADCNAEDSCGVRCLVPYVPNAEVP